MRKASRLILLTWLGAILLGVYFYYLMQPKRGENLDSSPWVDTPKEARNISFFGGGIFWPATAYEFDIEQEAFLRWGKENDWVLEEIEYGEPFVIETYKSLQIHEWPESEKAMKEITVGYKYEYAKEDQRFRLGYDKSSSRAYLYVQTR